ncbi:MAG: hypothetical protein ACOCUR_01515, partial [Nanoarchaeota archaeon]
MMALSEEEKKLAKDVEQKIKSGLSSSSPASLSQGLDNSGSDDAIISKEYDDFKKENLPKQYGIFEKACQISASVMKASPDKEIKPKLEESIYTCHLNVTPESATSFVYVGSIAMFLISLMIGGAISTLMTLSPNTAPDAMDFLMFSLLMGLILAMMAFFQIRNWPLNLASQWRMKASNNMIICVFYIVTFMRHTSNLENAIRFAADHVGFPLSLDLKRIVWDVETNKFSSITESTDDYLDGWKPYAPEFVDSMQLVESSLLQGSEERRLGTLDKSLSNILEQTYEKMLHYAHNLQGPLSNLNMLGVILPVLGMVILPLVVSMMEVQWYYLFGMYNIILFIAVFNLGNKILMTRPNGYGDTSEESPEMSKFKTMDIDLGFTKLSLKPSQVSLLVITFFLLLAFSPLILYRIDPLFDEKFTNSA